MERPAVNQVVSGSPVYSAGWLLWLVVIVSVAVMAGGAGWWVYQKVDRAIEVVGFEGELTRLNHGVLKELVYPLVNDGFLSIDLEQVRQGMEQHPWVAEARVHRQWPNGLVVSVVEEVPIARWGNTALLNNQGKQLQVDVASELRHLPLLQGVEGSEREMMRSYREMVQLFQSTELRISALYRDDRGAWNMKLSNGLPLLLGREQILPKVGRFLLVWEKVLKGRVDEVIQVDARYENGVSVTWRDQVDEHTGTPVTTTPMPVPTPTPTPTKQAPLMPTTLPVKV